MAIPKKPRGDEISLHDHSGPPSQSSTFSDKTNTLAPLKQNTTLDQPIDITNGSIAQNQPIGPGAAQGFNIQCDTRPPEFEIDFDPNDLQNPKNWPLWKRSATIAVISIATWVVTLYSSSYTAGIPGMMEEFWVTNQSVATLGLTSYMLGLAVGFVLLAPMSEIYGRRRVYIVSYGLFFILVLPCALATKLQDIVVVRFFGGCFGVVMISNSPGTIADISTERDRALAFSLWSIAPINGPVTGPLIGGFVYQYLGWRWTNWLVMIIAGSTWLCLLLIPETYVPKILEDRAKKMRMETEDARWWCRYGENLTVAETLKVNLARPFTLALTEPILWFWDVYMGVIYATLYLCFVAYPIVFTGVRGWEPGLSGLSFIGIGIGNMIVICGEPLIRKMVNRHTKDPATGRVPLEASISVVSISALLVPIGLLWFAWTSVPATIHWIWPILAGVPFGAGQTAIFIYANIYIAGSYGIYATSALAGSGFVRSVFGGLLPLAGPSMYNTLTPQWAGTLLGVLSLLLVPIPFVFYFRGKRVRERSPLIKKMMLDQERIEQKAKGTAGVEGNAKDTRGTSC